MSPQLLDVPTAAHRLGVGCWYVRQKILDGTLPATRYGQRWLIAEEDLRRCPQAPPPNYSRRAIGAQRRMAVLAALAEDAGATVQDLAETLGRPRRTTLGWVQDLDRSGLIQRRRGSHSKEPDRCYLTEAGRRALGRAAARSRVLDRLPIAGTAS